METQNLLTPVLFVLFNRPEPTRKVFEVIREVKPAKLYVAVDGPRADKVGEAEKVAAVRDIVKQVDWECDVQTLFRDQNLGCKVAVSEAISWFFGQEAEGIILEDDCLPEPSFFFFCEEMLRRYRDDERVMHISGDNFQAGQRRGEASYYFSKYAHIWGWATWKRVWEKYDVTVQDLPEFTRTNQIANVFSDVAEQRFWLNNFELVHQNRLDTWDFQHIFNIVRNNGLCVMPNVNLVSNIGFAPDATHTTGVDTKVANLPTQPMTMPLQHPKFVLADAAADSFTAKHIFGISNSKPSLLTRFYGKLFQ
ncbi:MAG: hypothetical protein JNK26_02920 [Candidatus Doudnabacteria bacterium]|nr:hypothetical protein [Candidatus Doudnabacteria bacterium]